MTTLLRPETEVNTRKIHR